MSESPGRNADGYWTWPSKADSEPRTVRDLPDPAAPASPVMPAALEDNAWLYGGDPCPRCGVVLDYDEQGDDREPFLVHPEPQCGWLPDGYPSTRQGATRSR